MTAIARTTRSDASVASSPAISVSPMGCRQPAIPVGDVGVYARRRACAWHCIDTGALGASRDAGRARRGRVPTVRATGDDTDDRHDLG